MQEQPLRSEPKHPKVKVQWDIGWHFYTPERKKTLIFFELNRKHFTWFLLFPKLTIINPDFSVLWQTSWRLMDLFLRLNSPLNGSVILLSAVITLSCVFWWSLTFCFFLFTFLCLGEQIVTLNKRGKRDK